MMRKEKEKKQYTNSIGPLPLFAHVIFLILSLPGSIDSVIRIFGVSVNAYVTLVIIKVSCLTVRRDWCTPKTTLLFSKKKSVFICIIMCIKVVMAVIV